jgi:ribosomal protein S6
MEEKILEIDNKDLGDTQIYELGFHLLPSVAEEELSKEVAKIHSVISELEGNLISEGVPSMRQLVYEITKKIGTKNTKFGKAYFGWIKFEMNRANSLLLKTKMDNMENVLRFIIVKTVRENTIHIPKVSSFKKENPKEEGVVELVVSPERAPVSDEEIDKSIDELLVKED